MLFSGCDKSTTQIRPDLITGHAVEESASFANETAKKAPIKEEPKKETTRKIEENKEFKNITM